MIEVLIVVALALAVVSAANILLIALDGLED